MTDRSDTTPNESGRVLLAAVETLGCKVNQYESSYFLEILKDAGYRCVPFRERADVYIVHSCAVTAKAGFQTRQLLRRAARTNPRALTVAAGCYAELDHARIATERLATHVLGNADKFDLLFWLSQPASFDSPVVAAGNACSPMPFRPLPISRMHTGRTRALLKVQDGCNAFCSYCTVPLIRGPSRSLPPEEAVRQVERFRQAGYQEIVLTGIHLGQWGKDLDPGRTLSELLTRIGEAPHPRWVRLSSLEPMEINGKILEMLSTAPWICPHLHIPLQSGDAEILRRMHRPYTPGMYAEVIRQVRAALPDAAIGADVLVGFPGETEKQFENTLRLLEELPVSYLHVFPFSPRPGTAAEKLPGRLSGEELKGRARLLQDLGARKKEAFRNRFIGKHLEVLCESEMEPGIWEGTSPNYCSVVFRTSQGASGRRFVGTITGTRDGRLEGQMLEI